MCLFRYRRADPATADPATADPATADPATGGRPPTPGDQTGEPQTDDA